MDYLEWIPKRISELRMAKDVSARDMSLSLGQSASYINKIENGRTLPSMTGFLYICEFFGITPEEFFHTRPLVPQKVNKLIDAIEKLSPSQAEHILEVINDLGNKK